MAKTCPACHSPVPSNIARGRPRKWCSDACRVASYRGGRKPRPPRLTERQARCTGCGADFTSYRPPRGHWRRTCSSQCAATAARAGARRARSHLGDQPSKMVRSCEVCASSYRYTYGGQRTCGRACGAELRRRYGWETEHVRQVRELRRAAACVAKVRTCAECGARYDSGGFKYCSPACAHRAARRRDLVRYGKTLEQAERCACGQPKPINRRKYCTDCADRVAREQMRAARRRRKARQRGATSEPYTLAEIAERDRYRCGLCRRRVAMTKAVPHPKAPTIDHVVPLVESLDDTKANVQLAHFICNSIKSQHGSQQLALIG